MLPSTPRATASSKTSRDPGIDALRGIAVLLVVLHHAYVPASGFAFLDAFLSFFRSYGTLGVDLFFLLSGYCIHRAYADPARTVRTGAYLKRRWWRIYPPYAIALFLAFGINLATNGAKAMLGGEMTGENVSPLHLLSHVFLVHNLSPLTATSISGPFWTIALEAQFYLLYLAVRPLFFTWRGWGAVLLGALGLYIGSWHVLDPHATLDLLNPFRYWIEWLLGAGLVFAVPRRRSFWAGSGVWVVLTVLLLGLGAGLYEGREVAALWGRLAIAGGFAALIVLCLDRSDAWVLPALSWLPATGLFSYSIYLTHFIFLDRIRTFVIPQLPEGGWRVFCLFATVIGCLVFARWFYQFCEKPFHERAAKSAG